MYRLNLSTTINGVTATLDATDLLINWEDVTLSYKRDGLGAVMRAFSTQFDFAKEARDMLLAAFMADGVRAVASVQFQTRGDNYTYTTLFTCALDFSTLTYDAYRCSINAVDNTIASKLKAGKSQKYQYTATSLSGKNITYRHLPMLNNVQYMINEWVDTDTEIMYGRFFTKSNEPIATMIPLAYTGAEIAVKGTSDYQDVKRDWWRTSNLQNKVAPFFTAGVDCTVTVDFELNTAEPMYDGTTCSVLSVVLAKIETGEDGAKTLTAIETKDMLNTRDVTIYGDYSLAAGDALSIYILATGNNDNTIYYEIYGASLSVTYEAQDYTPVTIRVVTLTALMQALVTSICGAGVTASVVSSDDRVTHTYLMAAESARGISGAQIYSSWADFCTMMDAQFGYVPEIDESAKTVKMKARDSVVFDYTTSVQKTFTGDDAQEVEIHVAQDMLASKVSIGYEKEDYNSVNGRDEWRWTAEYKTGIEVSDAEDALICPYRADVYGIEFLTLMRSEKTTDSDADEDIFLADCGTSSMRIDIPVTGIIAANNMPNGRYTQRYMALANAFTLGRLTQSLTFTSIQGNRSARVSNVAVTSDISLAGNQHLLPYELTFTTADQTVYDWTKRLAVVAGGKTYTGFVKDVRFGVGRDTRVTYTLIVNQIS